MSYARQAARPGPRGYESAAYRAACAVVKRQARERGEMCWFYLRPGHVLCPGVFDWALHWQDQWAVTVHHEHRIMDGGQMVPDLRRMHPAHRSCNSRDGLYAQNARRAGQQTVSMIGVDVERTSRAW